MTARSALLASLVVLLMSCGGGSGGESDVEQDFDPFKPDWAPPPPDGKPETGGDQGGDLDAVSPDDRGETALPDGEVLIDAVTSDLTDVVGDEAAVSDQAETQQPDEVEQPVEPAYETYGPMTISPKGILLSGQYVQFRFAEASYWKIPHERWGMALDLVKNAGFNGVYTSACWRLHEPVDGQVDVTSGNLAVGEFLDLAAERGLYVYFFVGPWVEGEAAGCLPDWLLPAGDAMVSAVPDGKVAIRTSDVEFTTRLGLYFDQVNAQVASRQVTSFPQGNVAFYQVESSYDLFYFLKDARAKVEQELLGLPVMALNVGLYIAKLRDLVDQDGISVPLLTAVDGDFENGGRRVVATGDTPGVHVAVDLGTDSPYDPFELKLWVIRKELRKKELHGQVYLASPGVAVGLYPSPAHLARALMAGADVAVVRGFFAASLPVDQAAVSATGSGIDLFAGLKTAGVRFRQAVEDWFAAVDAAGVPRRIYYAFRATNAVFERFGPGLAGRDLPNRTGPNSTGSPLELKVKAAAVGAIEDKWKWPPPGPAGGVQELFLDHFQEWFQQPVEATGRATYYFDSSDGTIVVHLVDLDELSGGQNQHERQDQITKLTLNGEEVPRHSSVLVPASDDLATGRGWLGWGQKFVVLNHPLGAGFPLLDYCSANLMAIRHFNDRILLVAHGKPEVKSGGLMFTEPGEISLSGFQGIPEVAHNSLPAGGVFTDAGGKIAVQFQHDKTGYLVFNLPMAQKLQLMATTSDLAETAYFTKDGSGQDVAVFGLDFVQKVTAEGGGLTLTGKTRPGLERVLILLPAAATSVELNGQTGDCKYQAVTQSLECTFEPVAGPGGDFPTSGVYVKHETYGGGPADLGVADYPDAFATTTAAVSWSDPQVAARQGVGWYYTEVELPSVPAGQQGFITVAGVSDVVSLFVNGTYAGSAVPLGNVPMIGADVASMVAEVGFRVGAGVFVQGKNSVALRVLSFGKALDSFPLIYGAAPLLPPTFDPMASLLPHLAVEGLNVTASKGAWGTAKVSCGAVSVPLPGPWTVSKGDGSGTARIRGMLQGMHNLSPDPSAAPNNGFGSVGAPSESSPISLQDGQAAWVTTTFSSGEQSVQGGLDLVLAGRSVVGLVFLNGTPAAMWGADAESLSQGLHSKMVQGAGTRQVLAALDENGFVTTTGRVPLPAHLIKYAGGQDNRVTVLVLDISPTGEADVKLPDAGTVTGTGRVTEFKVAWNRNETFGAAGGEGTTLAWDNVTLAIKP